MTKTTAVAQGRGYKPNVRRITVNLDEDVFECLKATAVAEERSLSAIVARYLRVAMTSQAMLKGRP